MATFTVNTNSRSFSGTAAAVARVAAAWSKQNLRPSLYVVCGEKEEPVRIRSVEIRATVKDTAAALKAAAK